MHITDYDAYLFDWDGTIAKTIEVWLDSLEKIILQYGGIPDRPFLMRTFGDFSSPITCGVPAEKFDSFNLSLVADAMKSLVDVPLYDDVHAYILQLKQAGKKLGLVTSSRHEALEIVLHKYELAEQFDVILTQIDVKKHKPDPEGIHLALERLGVAPDRAVMLGDSDKDLGAAQNAKIDSLLFYPDSHRLIYDQDHLLTFQPKHHISSWRELLSAVQ